MRTASIASVAVSGGFHDGDWVESKDQDPDGDIRLLQLADVGDGGFRDRSDRRVNQEAFDRLNCSPVRDRDILIARMPDPLGRACLVPRGIGRAITVVDVAVLRCDESRADPRFVMHAINAGPTRSLMASFQDGATRQRIPRKSLGRVQIPLPPLDEQRAIADYLDRETARIDTLIEEQQRLIDLLRERRVAVVQNAIWNSQAEWSVDKLGRRTRIGNGSTPRRDNPVYWSDDGFPWLNSAVVNRDMVDSSEQFVSEAALTECHLPVVEPGSVLVGLTGQGKTRGMATLLASTATVNQHLAYVTPEADSWDPRFLVWTLRSAYEDLRALSDENGSTKGGLTCADLKAFRVARPDMAEQRRIAAYLDEQMDKIDKLIAESERFIDLSRERRAALITAAVTGQIDVREVA